MSPPGGSTPITPGTMIGRYRLERRLGAGAMGEVFLGIDDGLGRRAALKLLGKQHLKNDTLRERFLREARAIARLAHPNLIIIFEAGEHGDRPYYAMELLEGGDTMQLLSEQRVLTPGVVASIGAQAAGGLAEAERGGITHRDVKPSNLGITGRGVIKVTDFGLAKSSAREQSLTGKGLVVGTADYIAPEQARGDKLDGRTDVYSLGCTLYHLLAGWPPYRRDDGSAVQSYMDVIYEHLRSPVPDIRAVLPDIDGRLYDLLTSSMAKSPDDRPTLDHLAAGLQAVAGRLRGEIPRLSKRALASAADLENKTTAVDRPARIRPVVTTVADGPMSARLVDSEPEPGSEADSDGASGDSDSIDRAVRRFSPRWPRAVVAVAALAAALLLVARLLG